MIHSSHALPEEFCRDLREAGAHILENVRLSGMTTFCLGGACPVLIDCPHETSFRQAWTGLLQLGLEPFLLGGGSNLLVSDHGVNQIVVRYVQKECAIKRDGNLIRVSAGTSLDDLARVTTAWGMDGLVICSGIPGTVGGAIAGNAGAFGDQIGDRIVSINVVNRSGLVEERKQADLGFAYRKSGIPDRGDVVLSALLKLDPSDAEKLDMRRREILELRATKHPDWKRIPTAGSFFKNIEPTSRAERRQAAGWFLEQAGALTMKVGWAKTFARHANIIIAEPGCKSSDVVELSGMMADAVKEKFGIVLEREVKFVGTM